MVLLRAFAVWLLIIAAETLHGILRAALLVPLVGDLPARHVIHAAAMELGGYVTEESLRASTRASLELAAKHGLRSIAFPAVGTGIGAFPMQRCAEVMLEEVRARIAAGCSLDEVRFVLFGEPAYRVFEMVHDAEKVRAQLEKLRR